MEVSSHELKQAVEKTHGGTAKLLERVPILERFQGKTAWEGVVHVFALENHPKATKCYAWSAPVEGSKKRRFYAVLHTPPINSPADAVRAAIVQDYRQKQNPR